MFCSVRHLTPGTLCILVLVLVASQPAVAALIWFDETNSGSGFSGFADLAAAYGEFLKTPAGTITFDGLPCGTKVTTEYQASFGVTFSNTGGGRYDSLAGIQEESGAIVDALTGYDGTYLPDGDSVYLKFDNDKPATPFTIRFDEPVVSVGAFLAMGREGKTHAVRVSLFDATGALIGSRDVESWLWESQSEGQRYETFFAASVDGVAVSRVEIRNLSHKEFANALIVDNVAWSYELEPEPVSEPATYMLLAMSGVLLPWRQRSRADAR